ncbi:MAG: Na+-transporting NADH:ubiquinone oxidoreductase subunit B, partial [Hyphomicrobiaceae bacterium]
PIVLATLPGTFLLIFLGLISWRVLLAAFAGIAIAGILTGIDAPLAQLGSGGFVFGLVFLGCDPVSAAATNAGRILYGFLIGVLTVIFGGAEVSAIVFAILLASIFAPMIDYIVVWLHAYRRRHSFG